MGGSLSVESTKEFDANKARKSIVPNEVMTKQSNQRFMLIWSQVWDFVDIFYAFFFFLATQILTALALAAHLYQKDTLCHLNEFSFWIITIDNILLFFASYFTYVTRLHALPVTR